MSAHTSGRRVEGRDPATGQVLRVQLERGTIGAVERRGHSGSDLPWLVPGLVDLQVNGYAGFDVNHETPGAEHIVGITEALRSRGVTTWVPTVITGSQEQVIDRLAAITRARCDPDIAAAIPFAHVEGPFISDQDGARGVHDPAHIRPLDAAEVRRWAAQGPVGYLTVSPHQPDAPDQVARVVADGVAVAIGHTHATPDQISAAVDAGASLSTHLGNGIFATLARHPNPIWTQLADDRLTCGLIGDGHHLPGDTFTAMVRALGPGRAFLVSDSVELAGSPPGRYRTAVGGEVELDPTGRLSYVGTELLAGAAVNLADCVVWALANTPFSLARVIDLAATTPGRVVAELGGTRPGRLRVGGRADLCLLDEQGKVVEVVAGGRVL
ncbi:N-acetylglucosamine-6-phosphate deacetylase [Aestuariimicrobium sp. Y1814]|uniref:N-acetylglucosamine-6-phosphate deacetylase n=1 Tax=Aestuariimicrobium sp. Y1814 TaxID=3418742 RepID=UPI003DA73D9C